MCHSDRVGTWLFEGMPRWLECTFLALRFSLHCKPCFLDFPGVVWHQDTPGSASKSRAYAEGQVTALEHILELALPEEARIWAERSKSAAEHSIASLHLREGALSKAWKWHIRSLAGTGGARYLLFSLRMLFPTARNGARGADPLTRARD